jgi:hypothetical protein
MAIDPDLEPILEALEKRLSDRIATLANSVVDLGTETHAAFEVYDERIVALELAADIPDEPPPPPPPPPPPDPVPVKDRTTPLTVGAGRTETGWNIHDTPGAPDYPSAVDMGEGSTLTATTISNVPQAVFAAGTVTIEDVTVDGFGGISTQQAHGFYVRHGVLRRCWVKRVLPNTGNGSASFHAHKQSGPVENLTWEECRDDGAVDAIMAGYVAVNNCTIDGFTKPLGKLRIGVAGKANGKNTFRRLDVNVLQLDGTFAAGTVVAGRCKQLVTGGGAGMSVAQAKTRWPTVDFSGLTVG